MAMRMLPVSSSLIAGAEYDDSAQVLLVTFRSGARWAYGDAGRPFTAEDVDAFESASSKGAWFLQAVKGQFPERRL